MTFYDYLHVYVTNKNTEFSPQTRTPSRKDNRNNRSRTTKKFFCKTNELQGSLTNKLRKKGSFSMILKVNKDASFHIRPFLFDLYEIWQWIRIIKRNVPLWSPPPPYRSTKKPTLIRVKSTIAPNHKNFTNALP